MPNLDKFIVGFDHALRTLLTPAQTLRPVPGTELPEVELSDSEKNEASALMRVNHVGEICAQALYQGQALTARDAEVQHTLGQAAREETEHLAWTERRIAEMGDKTQFATVALAARYDALTAVVLGTTLGMMLANAPAVWIGEALADRINMRWVRWFAAASFLLMGVWSLAGNAGSY